MSCEDTRSAPEVRLQNKKPAIRTIVTPLDHHKDLRDTLKTALRSIYDYVNDGPDSATGRQPGWQAMPSRRNVCMTGIIVFVVGSLVIDLQQLLQKQFFV